MAVKKKEVNKKKLVIVESPSKAKTIGKFLGSSYKVLASVGHIRDLPKSRIGIDIEEDFEPQYINVRGKGDIIKELKKASKNAKQVYIATDPDREGEAIAWHIAHILEIDKDEPCRIVFNEITKNAIKNAVSHPRKINQELVDAQQARRVLDRVVGYSISPLLWRKIGRGLSGGRVQSATLKLICDREKDIENFKPEEFWYVDCRFEKEKSFEARLKKKKDKNIKITSEKEANDIADIISKGEFKVLNVEEKEKKRRPYAPYTTSSLQQDSANKINFSTRKTMQIAQQLYEGIDIKGKGTVGLVTYIRTDSTRISDEAKKQAKELIIDSFGEKYYGGYNYSSKQEAQDAHEAIRPSYIDLTPEDIKDSLSKEQYALYTLIWNRFIASQMSNSIHISMGIDIKNQDYTFRASGSRQVFDGYLRIYRADREEDKILPHVEKGDILKAKDIIKTQNFTSPPLRFTEASLVKTLEELGIGRPSTYAPIVSTLLDRRYIKKEKKSLVPTELGNTVSDMMKEYFNEIVDSNFTAGMEKKLDLVGSDIKDWKDIIREFYKTFSKELEIADKNIEKLEKEDEITDIKCPTCDAFMVKKSGRFGEFLACQNYPECKTTMAIKKGTGVACPKCNGEILEKKSRRGKIFYGCENFPDCDVSYWNKPLGELCPKCNSMLLKKNTKKFIGKECSNEECKYKEKKVKEELDG